MSPAETFLRFAADCESMARSARDPANRAAWRRMAENWQRNAELFESRNLAAREQAWHRRRGSDLSR
jgi:hypothetical protein